MSDERMPDEAVERFERYLDALLGGERPSPDDVASRDEAEMARLAAEIAAAVPAAAEDLDPDPAFVEQLRLRMRVADEGIDAVQVPPPVREPRTPVAEPSGAGPWKLTRRQLLQAGLGASVGLAAGLIGASVIRPPEEERDGIWGNPPLVAGEGFWTEVANLGDLPPGSAIRFSTAAFDGYVVNDEGEVRALSSSCTHMGCTLHFRPEWPDLRCPCHGASFDLRGDLANGRDAWREGAYRGDAQAYPLELPPLVRPRVKVEGDRISVWTAQV